MLGMEIVIIIMASTDCILLCGSSVPSILHWDCAV